MTQGKFLSVTFAWQGCRWTEVYELKYSVTFSSVADAFSYSGKWTEIEGVDFNAKLLDEAVVEFRLLEG